MLRFGRLPFLPAEKHLGVSHLFAPAKHTILRFPEIGRHFRQIEQLIVSRL
jgi:hypothetical protein